MEDTMPEYVGDVSVRYVSRPEDVPNELEFNHSLMAQCEIDSLRAEVMNLQDQRDLAMKIIERLQGERDKAMEALRSSYTQADIDEWMERLAVRNQECEKLEAEREEWYRKAHENFKFTLDARDERDKALEKIKRQAARIRKLEGATNHAGGLKKEAKKMSKRSTPETDELIRTQLAKDGMTSSVLSAKLTLKCESLERERDEARAEWGKASMDAAQLLSEKTKVMAERDEAREQLAAAKHFLEKYIAERDDALEAFRELWASADAYLPSFSHETINRWRNLAGLDKK